MIIELVTLREECGGCPTHYTGETKEGLHFDAYLRHGGMSVEIGGRKIVSVNVSSKGLDGVCSFSDFQEFAEINGYTLDASNAEWSSQIEDTEKAIQELFKDRIWIKFLKDFYSESANTTYKKDERRIASIEIAEALSNLGIAMIDDDSYERKKQELLKDK